MASWKKSGYKKGNKCEACGFFPWASCVLQVDHIDGDRNNNSISNLQTLCANCHLLKTFANDEHLPRYNKITHYYDNW